MERNTQTVRVRFAPSPTGELHLGGARTALYNWLFARKNNGTFILRIEDTDEMRSTIESVNSIIEGLKWLKIDWDEGPEIVYDKNGTPQFTEKGSFGPYFQMKRLHLYKKYAEELLNRDLAYYCYCTEEELEIMRQDMLRRKIPPKYPGVCRNLTEEERKKKENEGRKKVLRFKTPPTGVTSFIDCIRGEINFDNSLLDDFVIMKSNGIPTYNFAVVIDDHLMNITHVLRGDDHISNTPKQILLYKAFGWEPPKFAHFPMIHGADRTRLSKRHGAVSVIEYKKQGYSPIAMVNYLSLLGWSTEDSQQVFSSIEELIDKFSLERCGKSSAIFDPNKLLWLNSIHIRAMTEEEIFENSYEFFVKENVYIERGTPQYKLVIKAISLEKEKIKLFSEVPYLVRFFIVDDDKVEYEKEAIEKLKRLGKCRNILDELKIKLSGVEKFGSATLEKVVRSYAEEKNYTTSEVFHSLRIAVSGRTKGPSLFAMLELLGKERVIRRIENFLSLNYV